MNEDGSKKNIRGIKAEWSMLVHSFLDDEIQSDKLVKEVKNSAVSIEQIQVLRKELSARRKKMNQSIEKIKIKLEKVTAVIENLELVGSDASGLQREVQSLSHEGEKMSEAILDLDSKIKKLHEIEDFIPKSNPVLQNPA
jgi:chromosome segregation ATPase